MEDEELKAYEITSEFVFWADSCLLRREFCFRLWPGKEFNKEEEDETLKGRYNYIYHRYATRFNGNFLSFLKNTPTYRKMITWILLNECKDKPPFIGNEDKITEERLEVLSFLDPDSISDNNTIVSFIISDRKEKEAILKEALRRQSIWGCRNF